MLLLILILVAGYWFDWSNQWDELNAARAKESELRTQFLDKKSQAINLEAYRKQLADIEQSFGAMLKQLPNKSEMEALLSDINQAGLGRGLQFELFKPAAQEILSDFYAELPISIKLAGNYHDIGAFASDVSQLSRIVTLNNLALVHRQGRQADHGCDGAHLPLSGRGRNGQSRSKRRARRPRRPRKGRRNDRVRRQFAILSDLAARRLRRGRVLGLEGVRRPVRPRHAWTRRAAAPGEGL